MNAWWFAAVLFLVLAVLGGETCGKILTEATLVSCVGLLGLAHVMAAEEYSKGIAVTERREI